MGSIDVSVPEIIPSAQPMRFRTLIRAVLFDFVRIVTVFQGLKDGREFGHYMACVCALSSSPRSERFMVGRIMGGKLACRERLLMNALT